LTHGTTTRAALPEAGKADFFDVITRARRAGALPVALTYGGDQVHEDRVAIIREALSQPCEHPTGLKFDPALQAGEFPATDALVTSAAGVLLVIQTADCLPIF